MDPLTIARNGMLVAEQRFDASANRVAHMGQDSSVDPARETVEQIQAATQFKMNVNVVKFTDDMWRSIIDIAAPSHR